MSLLGLGHEDPGTRLAHPLLHKRKRLPCAGCPTEGPRGQDPRVSKELRPASSHVGALETGALPTPQSSLAMIAARLAAGLPP